jgi:MFS family permease
MGIGPVYATRLGFSATQVAWLMGAALLGSIVWQWPIGLASDHMPRRRALLLVTVAAALVASVGTQADESSIWILGGAMFFFGGLAFPMYSVGLSHINDLISSNQAVMASSLYVFISGLGAISGPLAAAFMIDAFGPYGFWLLLAVAHGAVGLYAIYRVAVVTTPVSIADQKPWRPFPARASAVLARVAKAGRSENGRDREKKPREEAGPTP